MADSTFTLLNNVLVGLRRAKLPSGTTSISDEYHETLLGFINVAKEEAEEAWDWTELQSTVTVTQSAASDVTMSLQSSAGFSSADVTNRARLLYEQHETMWLLRSTRNRRPMVFDVTTSNEYRLVQTSVAHILRLRATDNDETNDPTYFALRDRADGYKELLVYPTPSSVRTFQLTFIQPQAALPSTEIDTTLLSIPSRPVWLKTLLIMNQERGEEQGRPDSELARQASDALDNAIGLQMTDLDHTAFVE